MTENKNVDPKKLSEHNRDLKEQNQRYDQATDENFHHKRILKAVRTGIADDQIDSFQGLLEESSKVDYEGLATQSMEARKQLAKPQVEDELLMSDIEKALLLAPRKAQVISGIADTIREERDSDERARLEGVAVESESRLIEYGEAWEIPKAISPEDRMMLFDMVNEQLNDKFIIEDIIPLTPKERESQVAFVERIKRQIKAPNATGIIIEYLKDNPGRTISREEFARLLYVADTNENDINHVTSRLGPKVKGPIINSGLQEVGLLLQYGFRYEKDSSGRTLRRTRIYRAVEATSNLQDTWNIETASGHTVRDEFEQLDEASTEMNTGEVAVLGNEVSESLDEIEKGEKAWVEKLKTDTNEVIDRLHADNLFADDEMRGSAVRSMSSSQKLGTLTSRERLKGAGLMTSGDVNRDLLTREQRVIAQLFNIHPELHHKKNGQKPALEIIRSVIAERLAELK